MPRRSSHFYEFGSFRLDADKRRLLRDGTPVQVSPKSIDALIVLVQNAGKLLERETLMQAVWADTFVEDANLTVAISHLRKALGQNSEAAEYIETIPRVGYRFVAEVREAYEEPKPLIIEKHTQSRTVIEEEYFPDHSANIPEELSVQTSSPAVTIATSPRITGRHALIVTAAMLIIAIGSVIYFRSDHQRTAAASNLEAAGIRSMAVLPIKNLTGDADNEYLSDGLTDGLINSLSKIEGLKVISRGSVFGWKGKDIDPRDVGKRLGVSSILEGSVVKSRDLARVSLRLVSAEDGRVLWAADSAEHSLGDVLAFQDELSRSVANSLRPKLGIKEVNQIAKHYTANQEAYQLYLRGRYFWNKRTGADLERSINCFEQAINLDPGYALAYSGLADSYAVLSYFSNHPFEETFPKAKATAQRALEIDNTLAEPHATLGLVISSDGDWARAESEYQQALQLNPNYATAHHWYGWYLFNVGRKDESLREMETALELDPVSIEINVDFASVLTFNHRPDEAIQRLEKVLEMDQTFSEAYYGLGLAYQAKREYERAIVEFEKAQAAGRPDVLGELGRSYALAGDKAKALSVITQLKGKTKAASRNLATVYLGLGEKDKALTALESACHTRPNLLLGINSDPAFDELHNEPRFQTILACAGLAP